MLSTYQPRTLVSTDLLWARVWARDDQQKDISSGPHAPGLTRLRPTAVPDMRLRLVCVRVRDRLQSATFTWVNAMATLSAPPRRGPLVMVPSGIENVWLPCAGTDPVRAKWVEPIRCPPSSSQKTSPSSARTVKPDLFQTVIPR